MLGRSPTHLVIATFCACIALYLRRVVLASRDFSGFRPGRHFLVKREPDDFLPLTNNPELMRMVTDTKLGGQPICSIAYLVARPGWQNSP
jgi:hypothetical protein